MPSPEETRRRQVGLLAFLAFYFGAMGLIIALEFYRNFQAGGGYGW
jgi:hypothetical protein